MHTYREETVSNDLYVHTHTHMLFRELWIRCWWFLKVSPHCPKLTVEQRWNINLASLLLHLCHFLPSFFPPSPLLPIVVVTSLPASSLSSPLFCFAVFRIQFSYFAHSQHNCFSTLHACVGVSLQACMHFTKKDILPLHQHLEPEIKFSVSVFFWG